MRGILWNEVRRVRLVTPDHPEVRAYQQRLAQRTITQLEAKFQERALERTQLMALLQEPMERLLTQEDMLTAYKAHVYQATPLPVLPAPTCLDCRECRADRLHPGGFICWIGWTGGPPKRLTTMAVCDAFTDTRPQAHPPGEWEIQQELRAFLEVHGIRYHAARWKAHQHDVLREAGAWGFQVGSSWEHEVHDWVCETYGERFFVPHRWLIIDTRAGAQQFREVDGIERVDETQAFVYEIKHRASAYAQLTLEYIPLLQRAYPERVFTPIEINVSDPYRALPAYMAPRIRRLATLEDRTMDGQYQLLVLPAIPHGPEDEGWDPGPCVRQLARLTCTHCHGPLWRQEGEIETYLRLAQDAGIPQNPHDLCDAVGWLHGGNGQCPTCAPTPWGPSAEETAHA